MKKGFTLIELLIVVAIIAILAAIAVPNFLEAQVRSKVSRTKADLRTLVTALEVYYIDNNAYSSDRAGDGITAPKRPFEATNTSGTEVLGYELTTPIAYITSLDINNDPFKVDRTDTSPERRRYFYRNHAGLLKVTGAAVWSQRVDRFGSYMLGSAGPDRFTFYGGGAPAGDFRTNGALSFNVLNYDPTNGTISLGDVLRSNKFTDGGFPEP